EDRSRPDWNDAGNQEAVRKFVGAPLPKLTQMDPYKDVVEEGTGRVVRKGAENPYRLTADEQASLRREGWDAAMGRTKYTVGATGERQDKAIGAASARQDKAIGAAAQRQATAIGARPAAGSQQNQRAWAQHVADFGRDFPGIGITSTRRSPAHNKAVGGVPGSYHLSGMAFDAGIPPKASQQAVRQWAAGRGMELIEESDHWHFEPRTGTPAAPPKPAAAKPAKLVTDASGVRVPDAPGVKVKDPTAPKPAKPFDAAKAGRSVRAQMGLRASERIRPDRKAEYDRLMAAEQQAHSRSQNGGKTALQMLLEMPD
ncbi:MAG: hypothetical protein KA744_01145, partial [Phenylobacterium sp.]|nr:hypothetical protein [Phenylobacterium sp.]